MPAEREHFAGDDRERVLLGVRECECGLGPRPDLGVAPRLVVGLQAGDETEGKISVRALARELHRRSDAVQTFVDPANPGHIVGTPHTIPGPSGELSEVAGVPQAALVSFIGAEAVITVLAHRLQQPVSCLAPLLTGHDERFVHQSVEEVERGEIVVFCLAPDGVGGGEIEP